MKAVAAYLRVTAKPQLATAAAAERRIQAPKQPAGPPDRLLRGHQVKARTIDGFTCYSVTPGGGYEQTVIYLHGGAYIGEITSQHWGLVAGLADAGIRVEVPIYGLAPRHSYREAYSFLTGVYRELLAETDARQLSVAGDSAGAGLALGFVQTLPGLQLAQPAKLVLISPWLDLTLTGAGVSEAERRDPWLSRIGLTLAGESWAGGDDPTAPRLSPINGPLSPLPPTTVYIGTRDLLHPDVVRLAERAAAAGTRIDLVTCRGAVHVYPLVPAPEGRRAAAEIVQLLRGA
jgi:monoterpene epsilon-lactone hydrolase